MADTNTINSVVADPQFQQLSDDEKKFILSKAAGVAPQLAQPTQPTQPWDPAKIDIQPGAQGTYDRKDIDTAIDVTRPFVANTLGGIAGAAAAPSAPFTLGAGPLAARAGTYSVVDALMQYLKSDKPSSPGAALAEGGKQALSNELLGGLFKKLGSVGKAWYGADQPEIFNFKPTTSQALEATGSTKSAVVAKTLEDIALGAKQKALDASAGAGFTQALQLAKKAEFDRTTGGQYMFSTNPRVMLGKVNQNMPPGLAEPMTFSEVDKVIQDPNLLEKTLTTAQEQGMGMNLKRSLQGYQFSKIMDNAATYDMQGNPTRIDPNKVASMWSSPELWGNAKNEGSYAKLYNAKQRGDITQFFDNIAATQDKIQTMPVAKRLWMLHGGIGMATGFFTGSMPMGAATSVGTFVGAEGVGRLLTNPKTARLMVALAGGEPLGVSEAYAARQIANVLQGTTVASINADGTRTPMVVGR